MERRSSSAPIRRAQHPITGSPERRSRAKCGPMHRSASAGQRSSASSAPSGRLKMSVRFVTSCRPCVRMPELLHRTRRSHTRRAQRGGEMEAGFARAALAVVILLSPLSAAAPRAEVAELHMATQYGIGTLAMVLVEQKPQLEKATAQAGVEHTNM